MINGAGLETVVSSTELLIDLTPPKFIAITAVDPEFDMIQEATQQSHDDRLDAWWEFDEPESLILEYMVSHDMHLKLKGLNNYCHSFCIRPISYQLSRCRHIAHVNHLSVSVYLELGVCWHISQCY